MPQAHSTKEHARQQFDRWAGWYDRSLLNYLIFRPAYLMMIEEIARWRANHRESFTVLDIGCGTASFARVLLQTSWPMRVFGVDLSIEMCRAARQKFEGVGSEIEHGFLASDSEHLPFASGSVDIVTCANSFHHYPHQQAVIQEMKRVLRRNGRLLVVDGFRDNVVGWVAFDLIVDHFETGVHHASWTTMRSYFESAGFRNVRQRKGSILPPLLMTIGDVM